MHPSETAPVVVEFPLRGEWVAPNTPGTRIPSHGTDVLGQKYAFDFVGVEPGARELRYYRVSPLRYLLLGAQLHEYYGWGRPIYAATEGVVVQAEDGMPERNPVHLLRDMAMVYSNTRRFRRQKSRDERSSNLRYLTGNHIIVESNKGYFLYAHAQTGSIRVAPGDRVVPGQELAKVGHSGNSTAPHLHFHLMDSADPWEAQGILCCFREYEVFQDGEWRLVQNGIPKADERIRKI